MSDQSTAVQSPEDVARLFHDHYERLAIERGYETRPESAVEWAQVPELNKQLMIATAEAVLAELQPGAANLASGGTITGWTWPMTAQHLCEQCGHLKPAHVLSQKAFVQGWCGTCEDCPSRNPIARAIAEGAESGVPETTAAMKEAWYEYRDGKTAVVVDELLAGLRDADRADLQRKGYAVVPRVHISVEALEDLAKQADGNTYVALAALVARLTLEGLPIHLES